MNSSPQSWMRYCSHRRFTGGFAPLSSWLSEPELWELDRLRETSRRQQWLAGRWLAKELLASITGHAAASIEITARNRSGLGRAPVVIIAGEAADWRLTISHTSRGVLAAVAAKAAWRIGADLTEATNLSANFRRLWFTAAEQAWIARRPLLRAAQLWALKESIFKACNTGEPWTPRAIEVKIDRNGCRGWYHGRELSGLQCRVSSFDQQTAAVVCLPCAPADSHYDPLVPLTSCL